MAYNMPAPQAWGTPQAQMGYPGAPGPYAVYPAGSDFPVPAAQFMNPPGKGQAGDMYMRQSIGSTSLKVGEPAHLGWSNVSFTLSPKAVQASGKDPRILKDLNGVARPGEVVALMGASGCGKTSLMNVLSGRATSMNGHEVTANITVNGKTVTAAELGPKVAYVMQVLSARFPPSCWRAVARRGYYAMPPAVGGGLQRAAAGCRRSLCYAYPW